MSEAVSNNGMADYVGRCRFSNAALAGISSVSNEDVPKAMAGLDASANVVEPFLSMARKAEKEGTRFLITYQTR